MNNFIEPPGRKKRNVMSVADLKTAARRFYVDLEEVKDLAKEYKVTDTYLRIKMRHMIHSEEMAADLKEAQDRGNFMENGQRKRADAEDKVLRYVTAHPGCSANQIGAAIGESAALVGNRLWKRMRAKITRIPMFPAAVYYLKGTEPSQEELEKKTRKKGDTHGIEMFRRYFLQLEDPVDLAKEIGWSVAKLNMRFGEYRRSSTGSAILREAEKLGHRTSAGRRIRKGSVVFKEALEKLQGAQEDTVPTPDLPKERSTAIRLVVCMNCGVMHGLREDITASTITDTPCTTCKKTDAWAVTDTVMIAEVQEELGS